MVLVLSNLVGLRPAAVPMDQVRLSLRGEGGWTARARGEREGQGTGNRMPTRFGSFAALGYRPRPTLLPVAVRHGNGVLLREAEVLNGVRESGYCRAAGFEGTASDSPAGTRETLTEQTAHHLVPFAKAGLIRHPAESCGARRCSRGSG